MNKVFKELMASLVRALVVGGGCTCVCVCVCVIVAAGPSVGNESWWSFVSASMID